MTVRTITAPQAEKITAVLEDLLARAHAGRLTSLAFLAEEVSHSDPLVGVVGRYREDLPRLVGELAVMRLQITEHAVHRRRHLDRTFK